MWIHHDGLSSTLLNERGHRRACAKAQPIDDTELHWCGLLGDHIAREAAPHDRAIEVGKYNPVFEAAPRDRTNVKSVVSFAIPLQRLLLAHVSYTHTWYT
eukprot:TRINITY_DN21331_c0_g1_i1.p1 TRINITY_DN21331_c0_g1~~TRINITY_DN21331_c0_g1_i1.p1  ORF type:complete len:100 (+),score=7.88 TRINITY_DN21331_c0_g1_i1:63-362(+)